MAKRMKDKKRYKLVDSPVTHNFVKEDPNLCEPVIKTEESEG